MTITCWEDVCLKFGNQVRAQAEYQMGMVGRLLTGLSVSNMAHNRQIDDADEIAKEYDEIAIREIRIKCLAYLENPTLKGWEELLNVVQGFSNNTPPDFIVMAKVPNPKNASAV
jgi:hypothetical protein